MNRTDKPRLVVTGARGFVAGSVLAQAGANWEVHAVSRGGAPASRAGLHWHNSNLLDPVQSSALLRELRPQAVIHTAAIADIDLCQAQPELAQAVNVDLTRNLAGLCADLGARLVFCSTDTIFDGEHAPYDEDAAPGPVNFYAETKVAAEQLVSPLGPLAVVARLALVVGLPVLGAGNSFLIKMISTLKQGRAVTALGHEVRTPVDVITAGRALLELAAGKHHGIFHLAGSSRVNRLELAQAIARRFGFSPDLVQNQNAPTSRGRAPRPRDVSLDNSKARGELKTPMRTLDEGLSLILESAGMARL